MNNIATRSAKSTTAKRRELLDLMEEHTARTATHGRNTISTYRPTRTIAEEREALRGMTHMSASMVADGIAWYSAELAAR